MQDRTPRERRAPYTGHFANPTGGAAARGTESTRSRASVSEPSAQRRPTGFAAPEAPRRRPDAQPEQRQPEPERKPGGLRLRLRGSKSERPKQLNNKRSQAKRPSWKRRLLIALGVFVLLFLLFVLIFGREDKTYHQMPRIERGTDDYAPEQSVAPAANNTGDAASTQYLVSPDAQSTSGDSADTDYSQYLVTPEPGVDLTEAAAAAGAQYDAGT